MSGCWGQRVLTLAANTMAKRRVSMHTDAALVVLKVITEELRVTYPEKVFNLGAVAGIRVGRRV